MFLCCVNISAHYYKMYTFKYDTFYNYYTNDDNLITDKDDSISLYSFLIENAPPDNSDCNENRIERGKKIITKKTTNAAKICESTCKHIMVKGTKFYITAPEKHRDTYKTLYFTIPTNINGTTFDFHYTFGLSNRSYKSRIDSCYVDETIEKRRRIKSTNLTRKTRSNQSVKMRYKLSDSLEEYKPSSPKLLNYDDAVQNVHFHKTTQHPTGYDEYKQKPVGYNEHKRCYFKDNIQIERFNDIMCINSRTSIMGRAFTKTEKTLIEDIMRRPFMQIAGRKTRKNKPMTYTHNKIFLLYVFLLFIFIKYIIIKIIITNKFTNRFFQFLIINFFIVHG